MNAVSSGPSALAGAAIDRHAGRVVELDRNGLEVMSEEECLQLLATRSFGRIAITTGALPAILPINYHLVGRHIVFRTGPGSKLDAATRNVVVAFEVDHIDPIEHTGWSVLAIGMARDLTHVLEGMTFDPTLIPHWAPDGADRVVVIVAEILSGRRLVHAHNGAVPAGGP